MQEHWLRPPFKQHPGVNKLKSLHPDLDGWGVSGMKEKMQTKILHGRPFGGTGFIWTKTLAAKPRCEYRHERVSVIEIATNIGVVLIINCYMPFFNSSDITSQINKYNDALGFVKHVMNDNPFAKFIFMGDMNCNIYTNNNAFSPFLTDFLSSHDLICSYDLSNDFDAQRSYTRFNDTINSYSLLDYVFISRSLSTYVENVSILDHALNLSDHLPVKMTLSITIETQPFERTPLPMIIDWQKVTGDTRKSYEEVMDECLNNLEVPEILHGNHLCTNPNHAMEIEKYYLDLVECIRIADRQLPRIKPTVRKSYWNNELNDLKNDSIVTHENWKLANCPRSGPLYELKKKSHYKYKLFLRQCKEESNQQCNDRMFDDLSSGNHHKFWKTYKHFHCSGGGNSSYVNGLTRNVDIANCFANFFKRVYDSRDDSQASILRNNFTHSFNDYQNAHKNDVLDPYFLSWDEMVTVLSKLKSGKATSTFIKPEHLLLGSPRLAIHLHILFNAMIQHSYVPQDFLKGVVTPLVKDSEGDSTSPDNYRGPTLCVIFSYLFERALLLKVGHLLNSDTLQFGYKKRHSCSHAIFALKSTIDYFVQRGSNVFAAFLDCTKGFDKLNHDGMFSKLMNRNVPLCFLQVLIYWYSNLTSVVKWNNVLSESFQVNSGVRQGGVLSPHLFAVYLDDLFGVLRNCNVGCHILDLFVAAIIYADDICLLAPCRSALQTLLNKCEEYGKAWCLSYNPMKSKTMIFGKDISCLPLSMYGKNLEFVEKIKYLGVDLAAGKQLSFSITKPLIKFRCSVNTIIGAQNAPPDEVLLKLMYVICVPNLTYAAEALSYTTKQTDSLNVAFNDCIRRIFSYHRWESVRFLRMSFGYPSLTEIIRSRESRFYRRLPLLRNDTLSVLNGYRN